MEEYRLGYSIFLDISDIFNFNELSLQPQEHLYFENSNTNENLKYLMATLNSNVCYFHTFVQNGKGEIISLAMFRKYYGSIALI